MAARLAVATACLAVQGPRAGPAPLPRPGSAAQVRAAVAASVTVKRLTAAQAAHLSTAQADNASAYYRIPNACRTATSCVYGDTSSPRVVVLYGDSHARMWMSALMPSVVRDNLRLIVVGEDGCPVAHVSLPGVFAHCTPDRTSFEALINAIRPRAILLSDKTSFPGFTPKQWQAGMQAAIDALVPTAAKVTVIGDVQVMAKNPIPCLAAYPADVQRCATANPDRTFPGQEVAERAAAAATGASYVSPAPWMCTRTRCAPIIGKYFAYWDSYHVSNTYAAYLAGVMGGALGKLL